MGVGDLVAAVWSMVICDMVMVRCGGKYIKKDNKKKGDQKTKNTA